MEEATNTVEAHRGCQKSVEGKLRYVYRLVSIGFVAGMMGWK